MLDQAILEFIEDRLKEQITVTEKTSKRKLHYYFKKLCLDVQHEFRVSRVCFRRMCCRNNLVHRRVTSVGQKVPDNAVEIAERFLDDMKNIGEFANIANIDETPCYFDIPRPSTIDKKGVQIVKVKTTGAERLRFTVALTAGVKKTENEFTSFQLPPLLIFKSLMKAPPGIYPRGMAVLGPKRGDNGTFHGERNLGETYLEKKARWVFQYREIHFINGLC